jgi:hypothetical protein
MGVNSFAVGDLVIVNEFDRPYRELIAVVVSVEGESVVSRYLFQKYRDILNPYKVVTKLTDFGVDYEIDTDKFQISFWVNRESSAKYPDGTPRKWQGDKHNGQKFTFLPGTVRA